MLNIKQSIRVFEIKQEVSVTGIQTLDNFYSTKEVDSQQGEFPKNDTIGSGIEVNPETHKNYFTIKLS